MTIKVRGQDEVRRYLRELPAEIEKMLRGAGRAGGSVIADEAKQRSRSDIVSDNVTVEVTVADDRVRVVVSVKPGWSRAVGIWLEYGTSPHFISVDAEQSGGRSAARVNRLGKQGVLTINGQPVGKTVWHPGAQPHPFLRPAADIKRADAIAAAQAYINARVRGGAVQPGSDSEDAA